MYSLLEAYGERKRSNRTEGRWTGKEYTYLNGCVCKWIQCQLQELLLNCCKQQVVANVSVVEDINQEHTVPNRWTQFTVCVSYFLGKRLLWISAQRPGAPHWQTGWTSQHFPHWHIAPHFALEGKLTLKTMWNGQENSWENGTKLYSSSISSPALAEIPCRSSFPFCCPF